MALNATRRDLSLLAAAACLAPLGLLARDRTLSVIAEVGALTGEGFDKAVREGADYLSVPILSTRDGMLVALSTPVLPAAWPLQSPQFALRKTTKTIGGRESIGWFVEDFTLAELKALSPTADPRRSGNTEPAILTLQEVIDIARAACIRTGRVVGLYVGCGQTSRVAGLESPLEARLAEIIHAQGYNTPAAAMIVEAEDPDFLRALRHLTRVRRCLATSDDHLGPASLHAARSVAEAISPTPRPPSAVVREAHAAGLIVFLREEVSDRRRFDRLLASEPDGIIAASVGSAAHSRDLARP